MRVKARTTRLAGVLKTEEGMYRLRVRVTDPRTGRHKELDRVVTAGSPIEAAFLREQLRKEARAELAKPTLPRIRLKDYARSWLLGRKTSIATSTAERYAYALELHVLPAMGDLFLDAITQADVIAFRDGGGVAARTTNSHLRVLRTLMADAVEEYDLPRNPTARVRTLPEEPAHTDEDPNLLTADELAQLLVVARDEEPDYFPIFATMAYTGMRPGEATALRWEDIDLERKQIKVRRSHHRQTIKGTKTGKTRTVGVPDELVEVLKELRHDQVAAQVAGLHSGWVFPSTTGEVRFTVTLGAPLRRCLKAAGIRTDLTPHGFRRTFNDLLRQVTTTTVQKSITGHSTDRMAEHYSHVRLDEKLAAANSVLSLVKQAPKR